MNPIHTRIAIWTAPIMFGLAVTFLVCQAILIVLWVDVPALREKTLGDPNVLIQPLQGGARMLEQQVIWIMLFIWPIVISESVYHWSIRSWDRPHRSFHFYALLFAICPSLRMCARSLEMDKKLWLPGMSWRRANQRLRRQLEQRFGIPMIGIALLILPVLVTEFFLKDQVARYQWLRLALHVGTGVIWFAFAAEFILMVSIAEKKFDYVRRNWVDLAIIALPLFSFLRSLQLVRGTRVAKVAKLSQITKLVRAYRLRGTVLKAFRALVLLDVSARIFRKTPQEQILRLQTELKSTQKEVRLIRLMIVRLENEIESESDAEEDSE